MSRKPRTIESRAKSNPYWSHRMYIDKRKLTDEELSRHLWPVNHTEEQMAQGIRDHLTAKNGQPPVVVKTDAPLTLTGQWPPKEGGGALVKGLWFVLVIAFGIAVTSLLSGCELSQQPPEPVTVKHSDVWEFEFPNGTYCVQSRVSDMPMECDFTHRKVDNLTF